MREIEDRRQRAREAYHDAPGGHATYPETRLGFAIETATRVQITDEAIEAFGEAWHRANVPIVNGERISGERRRAGLTAALRALGFEVVE